MSHQYLPYSPAISTGPVVCLKVYACMVASAVCAFVPFLVCRWLLTGNSGCVTHVAVHFQHRPCLGQAHQASRIVRLSQILQQHAALLQISACKHVPMAAGCAAAPAPAAAALQERSMTASSSRWYTSLCAGWPFQTASALRLWHPPNSQPAPTATCTRHNSSPQCASAVHIASKQHHDKVTDRSQPMLMVMSQGSILLVERHAGLGEISLPTSR